MSVLIITVLAVLLVGFATVLGVMGFATLSAILKAIMPVRTPTVPRRVG